MTTIQRPRPAPAKKRAAGKAAAKKRAARTKRADAKRTPSSAKKRVVKKAAPTQKKRATRGTVAPSTRTTAAKKRSTAKRTTAAKKRSTATRTTAAKRTTAKRTTAKRTTAKRTSPQPRTRSTSRPQLTFGEKVAAIGSWRPHQRPKLPATAAGERTGWSITILVIGLSLFGLVMVLSASSVASVSQDQSPFFTFSRQLRYALIGALAFAVGSRLNYRRTDFLALPAAVTAAVLLVAVLVPGVGSSVNGSSRWLDIGPVVIQPAELAKLALILLTAKLLGSREHQMHLPARTIRPVMFFVAFYSFLLMLQPKLGTPIIMCAVALLMLFVSKARIDHLFMWTAAGIAGATVLAYVADYRRARLLAFLDPWAHANDIGMQTVQSQIGIASGGLFGRGLGASRQKWGFLPEAQTDFIFAVVGEELGAIGAVALIVAFGLFGYLGLLAALRAPDAYGRILASGLTIWIITQAALNIGMALGLMPITGEPLPFVSAGGSSLITTLFASGLLVSVARRGHA